MIIALTGICIFQQHAADYPHSSANYAIVVFPYLFFTFFNASWSSGSWTYAAEIFPLPLRVSQKPFERFHKETLSVENKSVYPMS